MRAVLLIHGASGSEKSIEVGFEGLIELKLLDSVTKFYYTDYASKFGVDATHERMKEILLESKLDLIFMFHVSKFPIKLEFLQFIKEMENKPTFIYDEGDIFGGWAKPITKSMKLVMSYADFISIRGLGKWKERIVKLNPNAKIIYTPHTMPLIEKIGLDALNEERARKLIFIGNCTKSRLGVIRRLSGAKERESYVRYVSSQIADDFEVYGKGWSDLPTSKGVLNFDDQLEISLENWFHFSFEHYPNISHYYSDRLPISLYGGQLYITHYHKGYDEIFSDRKFIFFYKNKKEALAIINELMLMETEELLNRSKAAHEFAKNYMLPKFVWSKTIIEILNLRNL
jgi:hypothetical protein